MSTLPSKQFYVYVLRRPDGTPFYVGKGTGRRVLQHEQEAGRLCTCYKCRVIRKVWHNGEQIQRDIVFTTDVEALAFTREAELIAEIGRANLCNCTDGGRGSPKHEERNRTAKRRRGYGSVHQRKDGRWVATVDLVSTGGRRDRKTAYAKTRQEALAKLDELHEIHARWIRERD